MTFGLDKYAKATFFSGKFLKDKNITLDATTFFQDLEPQEKCKYMGVTEGDGYNIPLGEKNFGKNAFLG